MCSANEWVRFIRVIDSTGVVAICAEVPCPRGTGAQVRAWHLLSGVCGGFAELTLLVLADEETGLPERSGMPDGPVVQPPAGFRQGLRPLPGKLRAFLRRAVTVLMPWREHGWHLVSAGNANHETDPAARKMRPSLARWAYAAVLRAWAHALRNTGLIFPPGMLVRNRAWQYVLANSANLPLTARVTLIWCEHSYLFPAALELKNRFPAARILCNAHNVEETLQRSIAETVADPGGRRWLLHEAEITGFWERCMLRRADVVFCCSELDASRFRAMVPLIPARIMVVPNGVDTEHFHPEPHCKGTPLVVFTGTAGYPPNDDGVAWLVKSIWTRIRAALPNSRLLLAGKSAARHWSKHANDENGISVLSDVPDMRTVLREATICVVPLRSGSGTRLKILEAMSAGRAVVSTSIGAEGLEGIPGVHWTEANEEKSFAEAMVLLLNDAGRRSAIEAAGRNLVCERYSWRQISAGAARELDDFTNQET